MVIVLLFDVSSRNLEQQIKLIYTFVVVEGQYLFRCLNPQDLPFITASTFFHDFFIFLNIFIHSSKNFITKG